MEELPAVVGGYGSGGDSVFKVKPAVLASSESDLDPTVLTPQRKIRDRHLLIPLPFLMLLIINGTGTGYST